MPNVAECCRRGMWLIVATDVADCCQQMWLIVADECCKLLLLLLPTSIAVPARPIDACDQPMPPTDASEQLLIAVVFLDRWLQPTHYMPFWSMIMFFFIKAFGSWRLVGVPKVSKKQITSNLYKKATTTLPTAVGAADAEAEVAADF